MGKRNRRKRTGESASRGFGGSFRVFEENTRIHGSSGARHSGSTERRFQRAIRRGEDRKGARTKRKKGVYRRGKDITFDRTNAFSYGAWVFFREQQRRGGEPDGRRGGLSRIRSAAEDGASKCTHSQMAGQCAQGANEEKFPKEKWMHVLATYDGSSKASGLRIYVEGRSKRSEFKKDSLTGTIQGDAPLRIGADPPLFISTACSMKCGSTIARLRRDEVVRSVGSVLRSLAIPADRRTAYRNATRCEHFTGKLTRAR